MRSVVGDQVVQCVAGELGGRDVDRVQPPMAVSARVTSTVASAEVISSCKWARVEVLDKRVGLGLAVQ
jgi:hypothetical protein